MDSIEQLLFSKSSKEDNIQWVYVCPKCGSTDWKFPSPLAVAGNMFNLPHMVHLLFECRACGHIGIFFKVAKEDVPKIKQGQLRKSRDRTKRLPLWLLIIIVVVGFVFTGFFFGTLIGVAVCFAIVNYLKKRKPP